MSAVRWPTMSHQVNVTRAPNDPSGVDSWLEVATPGGRSLVRSFSIKRGRRDEFSFASPSEMDWAVLNESGALTPSVGNLLSDRNSLQDDGTVGDWVTYHSATVSMVAGAFGVGDNSIRFQNGTLSVGFYGGISLPISGLIVGQTYTFAADIGPNMGGSPQVNFMVDNAGSVQQTFTCGFGFGTQSIVGQSQRFALTFVATATSHNIYVRAVQASSDIYVHHMTLRVGNDGADGLLLVPNREARSRATYGANLLPTPVVTSAAATGYSATGGTLTGMRAEATAAAWGRTGTGWLAAITASGTTVTVSSPVYLSAVAGSSYSGQMWVYVPRTGATAQAVITWQTAGGGPNGASLAGNALTAAATPTYLNPQVTAVAPASTGRALVTVTVSGVTSGDVVLVGASQLESGFLAWTAFDPGSQTYPLMFGYEELGWPRNYYDGGARCESIPRFVDGLAILAQVGILSVPIDEMLLDAPLSLYPMNESSGSQLAANASGYQRNPAQYVRAIPTAVGAGVTVSIAGSGLGADNILPNSDSSYSSFLGINTPSGAVGGGHYVTGAGPCMKTPTAGVGGAITYTFVFRSTSGIGTTLVVPLFMAGVDPTTYLGGSSTAITGGFMDMFLYDGGSGRTSFNMVDPAGNTVTVNTANRLDDGNTHLVHLLIAANGKSFQLYVDGVSQGTSGALPNAVDPSLWDIYTGMVFCDVEQITIGVNAGMVGTFSGLLSGARITAHQTAVSSAYSGDNFSTRCNRLLDYAVWLSALRINDSATSSTNANALIGAKSTSGNNILQLLQQTALSVEGTVDVDTSGRVRTYTRDYRLLQTGPKWIFGENEANGELPYIDPGGQFTISEDPAYIWPQVLVEQVDGITVPRGNAKSTLNNFPKVLTRKVELIDSTRIADLADNMLRTYKDGHPRIVKITIRPSANPSQWPAALGIDIGDRVWVSRRPGAVVHYFDCYVESIEHKAPQAGEWSVDIGLSPAPPWFPWIIGDATYGVVGVTTRPV